MRVLVLNCGSSSLKFDVLVGSESAASAGDWSRAAHGSIDRIGGDGWLRLEAGDEVRHSEPFAASGIGDAVERVVAVLQQDGLLDGISAVGHRVVHGGLTFNYATLIDDEVVAGIDALSELAPLHNRPALEAIAVARRALPDVPEVACFDTSFYANLPDHVALYALPREVSEKYAIRRYGFHGFAHRYMADRFQALHPGKHGLRLITLQLGNGCSATASIDGRPQETSMGFTPLEGLIMGTRSGDLDPSLPGYIAEKEGLSLAAVEEMLNRKSGLLGLSALSADMRDLLDAATDGNMAARVAIDAFCHRVRKYIGAYMAVLAGADGIVFGGGIGQNNPELRAQICEGFDWAGLTLDAGRNSTYSLTEGRISTEGSTVEAWVMEVDEASVIAADVAECLSL